VSRERRRCEVAGVNDVGDDRRCIARCCYLDRRVASGWDGPDPETVEEDTILALDLARRGAAE
jgi:hypothetical protein